MTTIFENIKSKEPQTHVFIIGVGKYPHLLDGEGTTLDNPMGLKQLSSAPNSARAFADWILKDLNNPNAELGSVELLLSPASQYLQPKDNRQMEVDAATMNNIGNAFDSWYDRCNTNENNVAIFYFCGHGVVKNDQLLLPEDFGNSERRLLQNAINFRLTYQEMAKCKAGIQCYFIDSCRQIPDKLIRLSAGEGQSLIMSEPGGKRFRKDARIFYATSIGERAYGRTGEVTQFTKALIQALQGRGSKHNQGKWVIRTDVLGTAVMETVKKENSKIEDEYHQIPMCDGEFKENSIIHVLPQPPKIPIIIGLNPCSASALAELYIHKKSSLYKQRTPPIYGDWKEEIEAGIYTASAQFPTGEYHNINDEDLFAYTPYEEIEMRFTVEATA